MWSGRVGHLATNEPRRLDLGLESRDHIVKLRIVLRRIWDEYTIRFIVNLSNLSDFHSSDLWQK